MFCSSNLLVLNREDMYAQDSIDLLSKSGIQFKKHEEEGVDVMHFAELLMTSGVILKDSVRWITFHRYPNPTPTLPSIYIYF